MSRAAAFFCPRIDSAYILFQVLFIVEQKHDVFTDQEVKRKNNHIFDSKKSQRRRTGSYKETLENEVKPFAP